MVHNDTGNANTAVGAFALFQNTTGGDDSAFGLAALEFNATANSNTAVGNQALVTNTGDRNTGTGDSAKRATPQLLVRFAVLCLALSPSVQAVNARPGHGW